MKYRYNSPFHIPRRKDELIDLIIPAWKGTKTSLKQMDRKNLIAILYKIRNEGIENIMRKPLNLSKTKALANDTAKEGA